MRRRIRFAALLLGAAVHLAGCGGPAPTSGPSTAVTGGSPPSARSASPSFAIASPSFAISSQTPTPPLHGPSVPSTEVRPDPSLLALVPASAAGASLAFDSETTATVAADPTLAKDISELAIGLARLTGAAPDAPDFVIVNAVRLRDPGAADDVWFRDWRDTYDEAACAQAGGVGRHAQTEVDTLVVFIGGCVNGALTYHVRVAAGAVVLSMTSIGPADLGRRIVEELHR